MSALTEPQQTAVNNLRAWVEKIFAETISDNRLKATLVSEALDQYGIASATLARVMGLDAASLAAFLAQRIAPGEVFDMETEGGIISAPYLQFSKVRRQLYAEKVAFNITYRGAMGDAWLTELLAVLLVRNGVYDILDFQAKNYIFDFPAGTQLAPEYRDLGDATERTGRYLYPLNIDASDWENPPVYLVDPSLYVESMIDGNWGAFLKSAQTVDSGLVDYYYNKRTGQRLDAFSDMRGDVIAIDPTGEGSSYFRVKFTSEGVPVFLSILVSHEKWFMAWIPVLSILAMAATAGGAAGWLGGAVLGPQTAAAYPALTNAVGKLMITTIATGGDVRGSVMKFASGLAGGYFGDVLGTGLDSAAIGAVAGSVISTAIEGGDIRAAALQTIAQIGIEKMDDFLSVDTGFENTFDPTFDPGFDVSFDPGVSFDSLDGIDIPGEWGTLADLGINADAFAFSDWLSVNETAFENIGFNVDTVAIDTGGNLYLGDGYYVEMAPDAYAQSFYTDASGNVYAPDNTLLVSSGDALQMSEDELSAKLYQDWQGNQGAVRNSQAAPAARPDSIPPPASQTKIPSIGDMATAFQKILTTGAAIVAQIRQIKAGTYQPAYSAYPGGIPRIQAVGVPVTQPNGSTITNNGNGTQTIRYADGRTDVIQTSYAGAGSGSLFGLSSNTLLIAGGIGLAALLIAKRKG